MLKANLSGRVMSTTTKSEFFQHDDPVTLNAQVHEQNMMTLSAAVVCFVLVVALAPAAWPAFEEGSSSS
jgi:hypothetical protein